MKKPSPERKKRFTRALLMWNENNDRKMPWKGEKDPYKVWLSEIILQQTRVAQGLPYYQRFISQYPRVDLLAAAPEEDVFRLWQGLGYYSRCKHMLAAAKVVCEKYGGRFPSSYEALLALPGVGAYTAAAIASFAFNLPCAVVDGNVQRVLARYFGLSLEPASAEGKKAFAALADDTLERKSPGIYNQAIMDFGATVCTPRQPGCKDCMLRKNCVAFGEERVNQLPVKIPRKKPTPRYLLYVVAQYRDQFYLKKRGAGDIWENLHEFVGYEMENPAEEATFIARCKAGLRQNNEVIRMVLSPPYIQQLTHQRVRARFLYVHLKCALTLKQNEGFFLAEKHMLHRYAFPRLITRYLENDPVVRAELTVSGLIGIRE
jgi:A/G-specific adenine glycosylase